MTAPSFTQAIFDRLCEKIAAGSSLRNACGKDGIPSKPTVLKWLSNNEALAKQYSEAMTLRAEHIFDEIIDIADSKTDPQKTRVQIDARKWVLARMNPKKYGDRFTQELTGEGGGAIAHRIEIEIVDAQDSGSEET